MRFLIAALIFAFLTTVGIVLMFDYCYAVNDPNVTWVCTNKHALVVNSDGSLTVNFVSTTTAAAVLVVYPSVTIGDTNAHLISIDSSGNVKLKTN